MKLISQITIVIIIFLRFVMQIRKDIDSVKPYEMLTTFLAYIFIICINFYAGSFSEL